MKYFVPFISHINNGKGHVKDYHYFLKNIIQDNFSFKYFPVYFSDDEIENKVSNSITLNGYTCNKEIKILFSKKLLLIFYLIMDFFKFVKDVKRIDKQFKNKNIFLFFESFNPFQLMLYSILLSKIKYKKAIFLLRGYPFSGKGLWRIYFLSFFPFIKFLSFKKDIFFATDSEILVKKYESLLKKRIFFIPIPINTKYNLAKKKKFISLVGYPRVEKGLHTFYNLVRKFKDLSFVMQKDNMNKNTFKNLNITKNNLNKPDYDLFLDQTYISILAYDSKSYKFSTSGAFIDSVVHNAIPLVSQNTWMSYVANKFEFYDIIMNNEEDFINFLKNYHNDNSFKLMINNKFLNFRKNIIKQYDFKKNLGYILN